MLIKEGVVMTHHEGRTSGRVLRGRESSVPRVQVLRLFMTSNFPAAFLAAFTSNLAADETRPM